MRWLFFLLLVLNGFYYFWHQQQAPLRVTQVPPVSPYRQIDQRLSLLSETSPAPAPRAIAPVTDGGESCLFIGDFPQREPADALLQRLRARDINGVVRSREVVTGEDYWVHLPPLASRQAAIRQLRELQSRNVDSYVITVGDLENGVSLGIFSRRESADALQARVAGLGYSPVVRTLPRANQRFTVRVDGRQSNALEGSAAVGILDGELVRSFGPCEVAEGARVD